MRCCLIALLVFGLVWNGAAAEEIHDAVADGQLEMVRQLVLEEPGLVARPDAAGYQPIHLAVRGGHQAVAEFLLEHGADPNARTSTNWTPLHEACAYGQIEMVRLLLSRGAVVDVRESGNLGTPLHVAAFNGHLEAVALLLAAGAKVNAKDRDGWTALSQARDQGHADVVEFLGKHGGKR